MLPFMRAQGSGRIVNVSSVLGFVPAPYMALYAASKHAVAGLSETLDHEVRQVGVRVALIEPSFTKTKLDLAAPQTWDALRKLPRPAALMNVVMDRSSLIAMAAFLT
jgi:short-subunit dehydrogenase